MLGGSKVALGHSLLVLGRGIPFTILLSLKLSGQPSNVWWLSASWGSWASKCMAGPGAQLPHHGQSSCCLSWWTATFLSICWPVPHSPAFSEKLKCFTGLTYSSSFSIALIFGFHSFLSVDIFVSLLSSLLYYSFYLDAMAGSLPRGRPKLTYEDQIGRLRDKRMIEKLYRV